ncbi:site-specific integrase [Photobacterium sp. OFAV2-7]|uniref:tyrosine-type recombinase/integrase n=1 Tax=Photobacterium sp. OFAV2-7 TaxID=2917748 RepID=UPI001EF4C0EE|nr:site-specific integrase [Photobacterium sp. OFAV2-7]MCG7584958.1 tyrosine-type recombinase/integrase [Photobacterium sp. OFAV2-7]
MNKKFKFTPSSLNNLPKNPASSKSTELEFSDTEVIGLKCLVGKTGNKRFLLRYTSPVTRKKASIGLGRWPDIDLLTVRKKARKLKEQVVDGIDPRQERDKKLNNVMPTVSEFFHKVYLPLAKKRKRTWNDDEARFRHCHSIHNLPFDQLTANHLLKIQLDMSEAKCRDGVYAVATVNRVIALMKTVCKLAFRLLDIPNVGDKVSLLPENNIRTRYLDLDETRRLVKAAREYHCPNTGGFIALLFLTGCRDSELRLRRWDELDLDKRILSIPRTKNGSSHVIYLSDLMVEIFRSIQRVTGNPYIFAGNKIGKPIYQPRYAFKVIKVRAGIENPDEVVFHTARHSVASNLISNGVELTAVQKLLNHRDISSTQRYAKLSEAKQRDTASYLSAMVEQRPEIKWG